MAYFFNTSSDLIFIFFAMFASALKDILETQLHVNSILDDFGIPLQEMFAEKEVCEHQQGKVECAVEKKACFACLQEEKKFKKATTASRK